MIFFLGEEARPGPLAEAWILVRIPMTKQTLTLLAFFHLSESDSSEFMKLGEFAETTIGSMKGISRFDMEQAVAKPERFDMPAKMELTTPDAPQTPYHGAVILEGTPGAVWSCAETLAGMTKTFHAYRVTEKPIFDKGVEPARPTKGARFLLALTFHDDLPESAIRRSWRVHEPLAEVVHIGSNRYVQWWVDEKITPEAPRIDGIVEMHFPTEADLVDGFFDSERGRMEIVQDSAHFISGGHPRVYLKQFAYRI